MVTKDALLYYVTRNSTKIIDGENSMSAIMEQLKADHGSISRLLATLEEQIAIVHDEENADFELMHDIMVYMTDYPERTHHPMEDLVFRKLANRDNSAGVTSRSKPAITTSSTALCCKISATAESKSSLDS